MSSLESSIMFSLPPDARPWPDELPQPARERSPVTTPLEDGRYFSRWPDGSLRMLAVLEGGRVGAWLGLQEGVPAGYFRIEGSPWVAECYDESGQLEDFSPWDDNSPPYPAPMPFEAWAAGHIQKLGSIQFGGAPPVRLPAEPGPPRDYAHSVCGDEFPDLEAILGRMSGVNWSSQRQCEERLINYFQVEPSLARDLTNFGPPAAASVLHGGKKHESFVVPTWAGPTERAEHPLTSVPLYNRIRELVTAAPPSREDRQHWAWVLADVLPRTEESLIVWTLPPADCCPFWLSQVAAGVMGAHSSLREAFVYGPYCTSCWFYDPGAWPWTERDDLAQRNQALAEFLAGLQDPPVGGCPELISVVPELQEGELPWDGWRDDEPPSPRLLAAQFADSPFLEELLPGFRPNAFVYRMEQALEGTPELTEYLKTRAQLTEEQRRLMFSVVGEPVSPGAGYVRLLARAHWIFSEWEPAAWEQPQSFFHPALRLVHWLLPGGA